MAVGNMANLQRQLEAQKAAQVNPSTGQSTVPGTIFDPSKSASNPVATATPNPPAVDPAAALYTPQTGLVGLLRRALTKLSNTPPVNQTTGQSLLPGSVFDPSKAPGRPSSVVADSAGDPALSAFQQQLQGRRQGLLRRYQPSLNSQVNQ